MAVGTKVFILLVSLETILAATKYATISPRFKAAVYEHVVISPEKASRIFTRDEAFYWMSKNLKVFEEQTAIAAQQGAHIIVFPEYGITGFDHNRESMESFLEDIPDPNSVDWIPCTDPDRFSDTLVLRNLSCLARNNNIYVVANMGDVKACNARIENLCPKDLRYQFNTNVVFDADGRLVARYHKRNLYDESPLFDPSPEVEYITFDTPFGKFGTIVCFDLMHFTPTQVLLNFFGVKNLLVTSAWNVFYPFVMPTQMYSGLSKRNNINVIASNVRNHRYIMAGSGIFGKGVEVFSAADFESPDGVLLITELENDFPVSELAGSELKPIYKGIEEITFRNITYEGVYDYGMNMSFVVMKRRAERAVVCRKTICCITDYKFKHKDKNELYILGAVDFEMYYPGKVHMQFCAVHPCVNRTLSTCGGTVTTARSKFEHIKLQAFFTREKSITFPFVGTSPFDNRTVMFEMENYKFDKINAILESDTFEHPLLSAVIFSTIHKGQIPKIGAARNTGNNPTAVAMSYGVVFAVLMLFSL